MKHLQNEPFAEPTRRGPPCGPTQKCQNVKVKNPRFEAGSDARLHLIAAETYGTKALIKDNSAHAVRRIALLMVIGLQACAPQKVETFKDPDLEKAWQGVNLPAPEKPGNRGETSKERVLGQNRSAASSQEIDNRDLLPPGIKDPSGWAKDINTAFRSLHIEPSRENLCATIAVIAQESSFQAEPVVSGLSRIIRNELEKRKDQYHIPTAVLDAALRVKSPNGQSYDMRIRNLKTENDLNRLYDDMISELPLGKTLLASRNPVRTGGPMQVSLDFAEQFQQHEQTPYPYAQPGSLREEVFSRRGGVFYGTAYLLGYPVSYDRMLFRFADYNAGRYTSRNTGFQKTLAEVSGKTLELDGDLLRYDEKGKPAESSSTLEALLSIREELGLSREEIWKDLEKEKDPPFETSELWTRLEELARQKGKTPPRPRLPEIRLNSPKITSGLTTAGFARRVETRFNQCIARHSKTVR